MTAGSPAEAAGIKPDEYIESINAEPVLDEVDYQALSSGKRLQLCVSDGSSAKRQIRIHKEEWEPLGLCLDETQAMKPRRCRNKCMFCFVDQLPDGMRDTLYVKDDDWRLSLMMGNYVTLTNVDESEFERILKRKASPLYISVHATDPSVRCRMMKNPKAGLLMERLRRLSENGISFHCQIVLCPGFNDGDTLLKSIKDLSSLYPAAQSVAIVPIGLTRFRENLPHMEPFDAVSAAALLDTLKPYQEDFLHRFGTRFVFPSDEFYCLCGRVLPPDEEYEDYPQIENGVGMLRLLERECNEAYEDLDLEGKDSFSKERHVIIPTGRSAAGFIRAIVGDYAPKNVRFEVLPVINHFFGELITVTGLIVGSDLIQALKGRDFDKALISGTMLRENTDRFLDDMSLDEVRSALERKIIVVQNNGEALIRALWGLEEEDG